MLRLPLHMMCAFVLLTGLNLSSAHAFISVRTQSTGAKVRWPEGSRMTFRVNTTNRSGMGTQTMFGIFTTALSRWKQAALSGFDFVYYQGSDPSRYPNYTGSPEDNSIFFTSNAATSDQLPCGVIGLTEVWFDPGNGIASKADIRFNDKCYTFTDNPADTRLQSRIYLGDVAQHEIGHALGLDHSQSLQSTMIYTAAVEMAVPSCDDQAAMVSLYGSAIRGATGALSGVVTTSSGQPVFGAHVNAFSLERGTVIASALSEPNGSYTIEGLEPGRYGVMIEPYYPGSSTLGPYYQGMSSAVCSGGARFDRTFVLQNGLLKSVAVSAGRDAAVGSTVVSCAAPSSPNGGNERVLATAPVLASANITSGVGATSAFTSGVQYHYYKLSGQSGRLQASALGYSLYSPADLYVEFLDAAGNRIANQSVSGNVYSSFSGYVNYDSIAVVDLASPQDVYVRVFRAATNISTSQYPAGSTGVSSTPYYAVSVSRGAPASPIYAVNARCAAADTFSAYASQGEAPGFSGGGSGDDGHSTGACGSLENIDHDPMGPGGMVRLANFAGLIAMLLFARSRMRQLSLR